MKKFNVSLTAVFAACIVGVFAGCATSGAVSSAGAAGSAAMSMESVTFNGITYIGGMDYDNLAKGQLMSITVADKNYSAFEFNTGTAVRAFSEFLDELNLHRYLTNEEKLTLYKLMFENLPMDADDGEVREVFIGGYYPRSEPLTISICVFTPGSDASVKTDKVIFVQTDAISIDGEILPEYHGFISADYNAGAIYGVIGDTITSVDNLSDVNGLASLPIYSEIDQLLVAQALLLDENLENNEQASAVCDSLIASENLLDSFKAFAMLLKYEYFCYADRLYDASLAWNELLAFAGSHDLGDMTPEALEVINGETLYLLKALAPVPEK